MEKNDYYVYQHSCLGTPIYIGKGRGYRALQKWNRSEEWYELTKDGYTIEYLHTDLSNDEAKILETEYILKIGRKDLALGPLLNKSDGAGLRDKGKIFHEIWRKNMSAGKIGNNNAKGHRVSEGSINKLLELGQNKRDENLCKIAQYNKQGELINIWENQWEASKLFSGKIENIKYSIMRCCRGDRKTYKGFIWKIIE